MHLCDINKQMILRNFKIRISYFANQNQTQNKLKKIKLLKEYKTPSNN